MHPVTEIHLDAEALQVAIDHRLRARAARADLAVEIDDETLRRWAAEELESLVQVLAKAHFVAHGQGIN
jgi:hypothetical protein